MSAPTREELLVKTRQHLWAAWSLSSEELASQAADTLIGLGMLVPEGGAAELERLRGQVAELLEERASTNEALTEACEALRKDRDRIAELESAHPVMFRAAHDSIVIGYYTSAAEARKHCEAYVRREHAKTTELQLWWREDEDTLDQPEFGEAELIERTKSTIVPGPGMTRPTGYVVTPIEVSAQFDAEADE